MNWVGKTSNMLATCATIMNRRTIEEQAIAIIDYLIKVGISSQYPLVMVVPVVMGITTSFITVLRVTWMMAFNWRLRRGAFSHLVCVVKLAQLLDGFWLLTNHGLRLLDQLRRAHLLPFILLLYDVIAFWRLTALSFELRLLRLSHLLGFLGWFQFWFDAERFGSGRCNPFTFLSIFDVLEKVELDFVLRDCKHIPSRSTLTFGISRIIFESQ